MSKLKPPTAPAPTPPLNNPFAALAGKLTGLPAAVAPAPGPAAPPAGVTLARPAPRGPVRAVVRMERKGRGGKEATIVERLELRPADLEIWCKALKQALGCGGTVDGTDIILQGDLRTRLPAVLTARGVQKVTVSG